MKENKIIIIGLIVVIFALLIGSATAFPDLFGKENTKLTINVKSPVHEGDSIKIKLTDSNKSPIANQTINVTVTDSDDVESIHSVVTNSKGVAKFKIDKAAGEYIVNCSYAGNDTYNPNSTQKKIEIENEVIEAELEEDSSYEDDPGAFYSEQAGRTIYTGEVQEGPDGNNWKHLGYNEWVIV